MLKVGDQRHDAAKNRKKMTGLPFVLHKLLHVIMSVFVNNRLIISTVYIIPILRHEFSLRGYFIENKRGSLEHVLNSSKSSNEFIFHSKQQ